jgi:hypothetical protein
MDILMVISISIELQADIRPTSVKLPTLVVLPHYCVFQVLYAGYTT